jgi:hypothetical protein
MLQKEIEVIDQRVKDGSRMCRFAEESDYHQ